MRHLAHVFAIALLPAAAAAADRPNWAFPDDPPLLVKTAPDDGQPKHVPGSTRTYTQKEIDAQMSPPDWFPDEHPPLPEVVAHGNGTTVRACTGCHLTQGQGHPENSRLLGGTPDYLLHQLAEFKSGARHGKAAGAMIKIAKNLTPDEAKSAVAFYTSLKPMHWFKVVETDTVPKSYFKGGRRLPLPTGGTEPIGNRIIELPQDAEQVELRNPHSGFIAYVPPGSLAKGQLLVATGGGKTTPCTICHGPTLQGIGDVPGIAGRGPGTIARQIYYMQIGERTGAWVPLMMPVVEKLSGDDALAIAAYVSSLDP